MDNQEYEKMMVHCGSCSRVAPSEVMQALIDLVEALDSSNFVSKLPNAKFQTPLDAARTLLEKK